MDVPFSREKRKLGDYEIKRLEDWKIGRFAVRQVLG
jgi:hypothetical protein